MKQPFEFETVKNTPKKTLKPIEFSLYLDVNCSIENFDILSTSFCKPHNYESCSLIKKGYKYDVIMAIARGTPTIYLGHWNDGVME